MGRKETGALGEKIALNYLKKHGYRIIETNFRCRMGEIDIVTKKNDTLVFVEVRTKRDISFGIPEESVTPLKANHLARTAYHYRQSHNKLPESWRIDLLAIELNDDDKPSRINLIENAIEG